MPMTIAEWDALLRQWSADTVAHLDEAQRAQVPPEARAVGTLARAGASADDVAALEQRLGRALPDSYRSFLQATNGLFLPMHGITRVHSTAEVDWFASRSSEALEMWEEGSRNEGYAGVSDADYFRYDAEQDPANLRIEYLRASLEVGTMANEDFLLLNPEVIGPDGEWECLYLAFWLPGAQRYRSFLEAMEALHAEFLEDM